MVLRGVIYETMNVLESKLATTHDLVTLAKLRGVDLSSTSQDWAFLKDGRFISLWRTGGEVHYNLQGPIKALPERYEASASAFRDIWHEAGTLVDLDQAFELLNAWLIDMKEVDDLPERSMRREGIG